MSDNPFDKLVRDMAAMDTNAPTRIGPGGIPEVQVDPATGEPLQPEAIKPGQAVAARKPSTEAFACWRLDSMALLALYGVKSVPALVVLSHAIRAKTLGHGPIRMTYAFAQEIGATEWKLRSLLWELEGLQADLGWVRVIREPGKAVAVAVTDLGLQQMAPPRSRATR